MKGAVTVPFDATIRAEDETEARNRVEDEQAEKLESLGYSVDVNILNIEEVDDETNIWENQADGFSSRA